MQFIIFIGKVFLNIIYTLLKILPTKNKVVFLSRQSDSPSIDIEMLSDEIHRQHPEWKVIILCKKISDASYCLHMLRQLYHLATSRVAVLDSYCIPVSLLKHKKSLLVVQMWHSVGTMKKFGYSILDKPEGRSSEIAKSMHMHRGYDFVLASAEAYKDHLAEGFNCDRSIIKTYPLPRVEKLLDDYSAGIIRSAILNRYPKLRLKKNILYAPTFRKGEGEEEMFNTALKELAESIDQDKYNLIVKAHPLADIPKSIPGAIIDNDFSSFDMLFVSDVLISDYSCFIYEGAVRNIPLYLYAYDYDHYMSTRDIYMDYKAEVPGPVCMTAGQIASALEQDYDMDALTAFRNKYVEIKSPAITKNIADFIFSNLK